MTQPTRNVFLTNKVGEKGGFDQIIILLGDDQILDLIGILTAGLRKEINLDDNHRHYKFTVTLSGMIEQDVHDYKKSTGLKSIVTHL